jgi:hypothetical protein
MIELMGAQCLKVLKLVVMASSYDDFHTTSTTRARTGPRGLRDEIVITTHHGSEFQIF